MATQRPIWVRKLLDWIDKHPLVKSGFFPFIGALPPAIVGAKDWLPASGEWFSEHYVWAMVFAFVWPLLMFMLAGVYELAKIKTPVEVKQMSQFIGILSHVVNKKMDRMIAYIRHLPPTGKIVSRDMVKETINPQEQIEEIVQSVHTFFDFEPESGSIRVTLAKMGSVHIEDWVAYYPSNSRPRSTIVSLQKDSCGFTVARRLGDIHIIPSTLDASRAAHGTRGFEVTDSSRSTEDGSMICYPIRDPLTGTTPYVIAVCSDQKNNFKNDPELIAAYKYILDQFAQRVLLEHYWKYLKGRVK